MYSHIYKFYDIWKNDKQVISGISYITGENVE